MKKKEKIKLIVPQKIDLCSINFTKNNILPLNKNGSISIIGKLLGGDDTGCVDAKHTFDCYGNYIDGVFHHYNDNNTYNGFILLE